MTRETVLPFSPNDQLRESRSGFFVRVDLIDARGAALRDKSRSQGARRILFLGLQLREVRPIPSGQRFIECRAALGFIIVVPRYELSLLHI